MQLKPMPGFLAALLISAGLPVHADGGDVTLPMSRQLLMKRNLEGDQGTSPEVRVIRVNFPTGFKTPLHTHDAQGPRYVIKGRLRVEDHGKTDVYGPGDTFWETGEAMTIESIGGSDAEMIIFEVAAHKD